MRGRSVTTLRRRWPLWRLWRVRVGFGLRQLVLGRFVLRLGRGQVHLALLDGLVGQLGLVRALRHALLRLLNLRVQRLAVRGVDLVALGGQIAGKDHAGRAGGCQDIRWDGLLTG